MFWVDGDITGKKIRMYRNIMNNSITQAHIKGLSQSSLALARLAA